MYPLLGLGLAHAREPHFHQEGIISYTLHVEERHAPPGVGMRLVVRRCSTACSAPYDKALVDPASLSGKGDLAPLAAVDHFDGAAPRNSREHRLAIARPGTHAHVGNHPSDTDRSRSVGSLHLHGLDR